MAQNQAEATEVSVVRQQLDGELVRVVAGHDREWDLALVAVLRLHREDVFDVQLQETHLTLGQVRRQRDLDAVSLVSKLHVSSCLGSKVFLWVCGLGLIWSWTALSGACGKDRLSERVGCARVRVGGQQRRARAKRRGEGGGQGRRRRKRGAKRRRGREGRC
eukprot:2336856-Rhodomonas_salina.4